ncbi:MAG: hypothetical protein V7L02_02785, partial [Nostoc sp.]
NLLESLAFIPATALSKEKHCLLICDHPVVDYDKFGVGSAQTRHRTLIIRLWVKIQPQKQWDIVRKYR